MIGKLILMRGPAFFLLSLLSFLIPSQSSIAYEEGVCYQGLAGNCDTYNYNPGPSCSAGWTLMRGGKCMPSGSVDCGDGRYCSTGEICKSYGCMSARSVDCGYCSCPLGKTCMSAGRCMPVDSVDCGDYYCPSGNVCKSGAKCMPSASVDCGPNKGYCTAGQACTSGRGCMDSSKVSRLKDEETSAAERGKFAYRNRDLSEMEIYYKTALERCSDRGCSHDESDFCLGMIEISKGYRAMDRANHDTYIANYDNATLEFGDAETWFKQALRRNIPANDKEWIAGLPSFLADAKQKAHKQAEDRRIEHDHPGSAANQRLMNYVRNKYSYKFEHGFKAPPSPNVTNPSKLSDLKQMESDETAWLLDRTAWILDYVPRLSSNRIRHSLFRTLSGYTIPGEDGRVRWKINIDTEENCRGLFQSIVKDLRERGELDENTERSIDKLEFDLLNDIRKGLNKLKVE